MLCVCLSLCACVCACVCVYSLCEFCEGPGNSDCDMYIGIGCPDQ